MENLQKLFAISLASISILAAGCGGSGGPPTPPWNGPQGASNFAINTTVGPYSSSAEVWPNVTIQGWDVTQSACSPATDSACVMEVGGPYLYAVTQNKIGAFNTNSYGQANFGTDAIGDEWNFYATDNGSTQCNEGSASNTTLQGGSSGEPVNLSCNMYDADMVATPSSCAPNACPTTITLTYPPPISSNYTLPLNTELTAAVFNNTGANLRQSNVQAATTTSVVVPTPTAYGTTYLGVYNAAGSLIGASEFAILSPPETCNSQPFGSDGLGAFELCIYANQGSISADVNASVGNGNYPGHVSASITLTDQTAGIQIGSDSDPNDFGSAYAITGIMSGMVEGHTYQACGTASSEDGRHAQSCVNVIYAE